MTTHTYTYIHPWSAFSATERPNSSPISFDQQAQVSQRHTSCGNRENCNTEAHGGGGLGLMKQVREPASSRPKPCASIPGKRPTNLARPTLLLVDSRRKKTDGGQRTAFPTETSRFVPLIIAHKSLAGEHHLQPTRPPLRVSTDWLNREDSQLVVSVEGEFSPTPAGKTLSRLYPKTRFRRERVRTNQLHLAEETTGQAMPHDTERCCHFAGCASEACVLDTVL